METDDMHWDLEDDRKPAAVPDSAKEDKTVYDVNFRLHPRSGVVSHVRPPVKRTIPEFYPPDPSGSNSAQAKTTSVNLQKGSSKKRKKSKKNRAKKPPPEGTAVKALRHSADAQEDRSGARGRPTREKSKPDRFKAGVATFGSDNISNASFMEESTETEASSDGEASPAQFARKFQGVRTQAPQSSKKRKTKHKNATSTFQERAATSSTVGLPGTRIKVPKVHDILMGRGNRIARHAGNIIFRFYCWRFRQEYAGASRRDKTKVAFKVLDQILSHESPGRFLEREGDYWVEVDEAKRLEKICQALREKKWYPVQPELLAKAIQLRDYSSLQTASQEPTGESSLTKLGNTVDAKKASSKKKNKKRKRRSPPTSSTASLKAPPQATLKAPPQSNSSSNASAKTPPKTTTVTEADSGRSKPAGELTVGSRIKVYWPFDQTHHPAEVHDCLHGFCYLRYDDGESEWLDLTQHNYEVISYGTGVVQGRGPAPDVDLGFVPIAPRPEEKE